MVRDLYVRRLKITKGGFRYLLSKNKLYVLYLGKCF
jgi:hypothetical protein